MAVAKHPGTMGRFNMLNLHHVDLPSGRVTREDHRLEFSPLHTELVALVASGGGDIAGAPGWSCRIGPMRELNGTAGRGSAHMALYFKGWETEPSLSIVGVCCWEPESSPLAWELVERMIQSFPLPGDPPLCTQGPTVPWLVTMRMPVARQMPVLEMATGVSCAADLAWALVAP